MTTAEIKKIVADERTEQLTVQMCRHWQVAADRLECLVQELTDGMDTCVEAEVYAAIMRMQSAMTALLELNKMPCTFLFSEYLERIGQTMSNPRMRQAVMILMARLMNDESTPEQTSFFDLLEQMLAQHMALPAEKQEAIQKQVSPMGYILSLCAQYMNPNDLMMLAPILQSTEVNSDDDQEETANLFIIKDLLLDEEIDWLNQYHQQVFDTLTPDLNKEEAVWLKQVCQPIAK